MRKDLDFTFQRFGPVTNTIGMLVPTRERPANFRRFVESVIFRPVASHPDRIEVHCYIDQDDAELDAYMAIIEDLEKSDGVTFQLVVWEIQWRRARCNESTRHSVQN